jgi:zinc protease
MDYTVFSLWVLRDKLEPALALLGSMALEPAFREREIEAMIRTMFYELRAQNANPEVLGRRQLLRLLFESHPYGTAGFDGGVFKFITKKSIVDFYQAHYRADNAEVVISGDIDRDTAAELVSRYFNTWTPGGPDPPPPPPAEPNDRERICFLDFPGIEDALVLVGNVIPALAGQDDHSLLVLDHILGGSTGSRLFMTLRESKGYAFNAFSGFERYESGGMYWALARLTPEAMIPGILAICSELRSLATERYGPAEIEEAKAFLIGNLPLQFESPANFAARLSQHAALDLDDGHWRGLAENIIRVTAEKTQEIAAKVLTPKPVVLVLGRRQSLVDGLLETFDSVEIYDPSGGLVEILSKGEIP